MPQKHITWLEISKKALKHNILQFKSILPKQTQIMAVVKSNAYGHGLVACAKEFTKAGCQWLGTVNLDEALTLRKNHIQSKILVLSFFSPDKLEQAVKKKISLTIYSYSAAKQLSLIGRRLNTTVHIHCKIDTGTSRLGIQPKNAIPLIKKIAALPRIKIEGIFSHFADAEKPNQLCTKKQLSTFHKLVTNLSEEGITIPIKHIACSAAALLNKKSHLNLVRLGISAYGLWSIEKNGRYVNRIYSRTKLKSALSWHTTIVQIKELAKGSTIGYGCTYKTNKKTKIALLPVGYWDGYDRQLSNNGQVLIHGTKCKIRGRVCMNIIMTDITHLKNVKVGDKVTLIGQQRINEITTDELADKAGTINYEIVTRINPLLPRIFK